MNDLLSQSLAHFELLNHFDEQVMYRDLYSQNIENYQSIITTELIERLTKSESDLFERYDSLIASLINIQNNAKSTVFWNWILAKRKKVFENSKVFQIKEEYNNINENIFLGRNLNLLLSTRDEIDNIALICENEKKAPTNFLTLEKTQIIDKMQDMSGFGSRFNLHPIHLLIVEQYTSSVIALHACGKVVSNGNSFFNADKLELVSFNNLIEILLHITLMIPSRDDVDLFIDEGPFGSLVGENQQEINILYSFDSSTMLKNNFKYLRGMALGSREKFENILNHLDIVVREDRSSAID